MKSRQKCELCGDYVEPSLVSYRRKQRLSGILCRTCHKHDLEKRALERKVKRQEKHDELKALFASRRCVVCGKAIPWKDKYLTKKSSRWPVTCSPTCHGIHAKRASKLTKEQIEARIIAVIKEQGKQLTYREVIQRAHIASKLLCKYNISILDIEKRILGIDVGRTCDVKASDVPVESLSQLCTRLGIELKPYSDVAHVVISRLRVDGLAVTKQNLYDVVLSYIKQRGCYTGVTAIMNELGLSFDVLREHYKLDISGMNRLLGYRDTKSSWYEQTVYEKLSNIFGIEKISREHTFTDCRSMKNFPLRFDFYIPSIKLLIEIDGSQHKEPTNGYFKKTTVINDVIKSKYAVEHGYILLRINTAPRFTFLSRFDDALMGVLKRIELLGTLPDNAEGNQQPSQ